MIKITKIKIELSDWLYNAGIVGFLNILDYAKSDFVKGKNYIEFDSDVLNGFEEKFFNYFVNKYKKFTSWYKIISFKNSIEKYENEDISKKDLDIINEKIGQIKDYLKSNSYKSAYEILNDKSILDLSKKLNKIKLTKKDTIDDKKESILEQLKILKEIIKKLESDDLKKYITAKNVIYDYIAIFWENVSFLSKDKSKNCMFEEYKSYFVDNTIDYLNADKSSFKFWCFSCDNEIKSFSDGFGLAWIKKLGVDYKRKSSHFWNLNSNSNICPVCNIIYSCIPAGFTFFNRNGFFVNINSGISSLISANKHSLEESTTLGEVEQMSYYKIIESISLAEVYKSDKEIENIQIVKIDGNNDSRPYTFNVLSKEKLKLVEENKNNFKKLIKVSTKINNTWINVYRESIKAIYENRNLFKLISDLFIAKLSGDFERTGSIGILIEINNNFLGGIMKQQSIDDKRIYVIKRFGLEMKKLYKERKAENKLSGISYRFVNALKTKNKSRFMDTLMNTYMYIGAEIPAVFIEALNDNEKFQTIGYSFLLGLQGEEYKKENNSEKGGKTND